MRFAAVLLALTLAPGMASASPSIWEKAAHPRAATEDEALEDAEKALSRDFSLSQMPTTFRRAQILKRALRALEKAGAVTSQNAELRYRLAQVYYRLYDVEREPDYVTLAVDHFEFYAQTESAPVTERARALNSLAICYARLGKHKEEIAAYDAAIALQPDPISHAILLANQAEGYMATGDIIAAVHGYRESLHATPSVLMLDGGVTTMWGLAVALDRSGDLDGAIEQVRRARSYDPRDEHLHGVNWFYVPDYDEDWYTALGHWQLARDVEDIDVSVEAYRSAVRSWHGFVERAAMNDPWLPIGDYRLHQCEDELANAEERAQSERLKVPKVPKDPSLWPIPEPP